MNFFFQVDGIVIEGVFLEDTMDFDNLPNKGRGSKIDSIETTASSGVTVDGSIVFNKIGPKSKSEPFSVEEKKEMKVDSKKKSIFCCVK